MTKIKLTQREIQIIQLLAQGNIDNEIAQLLGLSYWTINKDIAVLLKMSGSENRTQLVAWAFRNKILK